MLPTSHVPLSRNVFITQFQIHSCVFGIHASRVHENDNTQDDDDLLQY